MMARTWIQPWQPKHYLQDKHIKYNPEAAEAATAEGYVDWPEYFFSWFGNWQDAVHRYGVPKLESHVLVEENTEYTVKIVPARRVGARLSRDERGGGS